MNKIIVIFLIFITYDAYSQYSADAGLNSIIMNKNDKESNCNYNYAIGLGVGENNVILNSYKMTLFYSPLDKMTFFIGLPFSVVSGDLGKQTGVGDLDLGIQYSLELENKHKIRYSMSLKSSLDRDARYKIFPSGIAEPLPMVYHPSLGNDNLIIVINYLFDKWDIAGGVLIPFSQPAKNKYVSSQDLKNTIVPYIFDSYTSSAGLTRGTDIMLKASREVYKNDKFTINAGVNPIYRLGNSKIEFTENGVVKNLEVENSGGLCLNLFGSIDYSLNSENYLTFSLGLPVLKRENPNDGLYRMFQSNLSITGNILK